jgi:hypothetical protein
MKVRQAVIYTGEVFEVPQGIQRIDTKATHGWQVRYGGTQLFSDRLVGGGDPARSLALATKELLKRIAAMPAPTKLQPRRSVNKSTDLPVGISGPMLRLRKGSEVRDISLSVLEPLFGRKPRRRTIYIGTENTYTKQRFKAALARAIEMRQAAEAKYQLAETRAKRAEGREFKASLVK